MSSNSENFRKRRKFTLLELLAVMVVTAILMGITLQMGKQSPIKQNARMIGSYIRMAQAQAVSKNIHVAAIISQDFEGNPQIGVYRWYYDPTDINTVRKIYIPPDTNKEWVDISTTAPVANKLDWYRALAVVPGTKPVILSGVPKFKGVTIDNANDNFAVFLFKPGGIPASLLGVSGGLKEITIQDENSQGEMKIIIDTFSGKVNYN